MGDGNCEFPNSRDWLRQSGWICEMILVSNAKVQVLRSGQMNIRLITC